MPLIRGQDCFIYIGAAGSDPGMGADNALTLSPNSSVSVDRGFNDVQLYGVGQGEGGVDRTTGNMTASVTVIPDSTNAAYTRIRASAMSPTNTGPEAVAVLIVIGAKKVGEAGLMSYSYDAVPKCVDTISDNGHVTSAITLPRKFGSRAVTVTPAATEAAS